MTVHLGCTLSGAEYPSNDDEVAGYVPHIHNSRNIKLKYETVRFRPRARLHFLMVSSFLGGGLTVCSRALGFFRLLGFGRQG